jgi:Tol biopolymer transport system component
LSSFPGREIDPALSPDGRQVAFAWDGGAPGGDFEIYVMLIGAGAPLRLTAQVGRDTNPSWSPDGRFVAFARAQGGETSLHLVPSLGGAERKLATLGLGALWYGLSIPTAWSPDGRSLVFPDRTSPDEPPGLYRLSLESLERRRITSPPRGALWDWGPAFAPDGTSLAFIRQGEGISRIYRVPVAGGEPALLTSDNVQALGGLGWTSDGRHVVFSSDRDGVWSLWRVPAQGGRAERLGIGQGSGSSVSSVSLQGDRSISLQGDRLAYVQSSDDQDIWRLDLTGAGGARAEPTKWISTTRFESAPQFSPDGARIAFESTRSGPMEIWTCRSDGSNPFQLTSLGTQWTGTPRWSPDGRQIAFDARPRGHSEILVVNAEGGTPRPVSSEGFNDWVPSWSRDGRWIYFGSDRSGRREVWKTPVGGGQAVQVTRNGGFAAFESPDGQSLYYSQFDAPGIFMVPVGGGEERRVLDGLSAGYWGYWAVVDTGLFFVDAAATPAPVLRFFDHASRRVATSSVLGRELNKFDSGLAVSPDGRWALYVRVDRRGSDLMLVENLQ